LRKTRRIGGCCSRKTRGRIGRQAIAPDELIARDARRLRWLEHLIAEGALNDADDYFHAAMLLQHGPDRVHHQRAHELAKQRNWAASRHAGWLRPPTTAG
jgi:hypothetical protein